MGHNYFLLILIFAKYVLTQNCGQGNWFKGYNVDAGFDFTTVAITTHDSEPAIALGGTTTKATDLHPNIVSNPAAVLLLGYLGVDDLL